MHKKAINLGILLAAAVVLCSSIAVKAQLTYSVGPSWVTVSGYSGGLGDVVIPSVVDGLPVIGIGYYALYEAPIASVTIPDSVKFIADGAFGDCYGMTNVTFGDGVTNIGMDAFDGCRLTGITLPGSLTSIGAGAFGGTWLTNVTISGGVTNIGVTPQ